MTNEHRWWIIAVLLQLAAVLRYWIGRHDEQHAPAPRSRFDEPSPPWYPADTSDEDEVTMRAALTLDVEEFERVALPVFESRGYSRNTALVAWWLRDVSHNVVQMHLSVRELQLEIRGDGPDDKKEPWRA